MKDLIEQLHQQGLTSSQIDRAFFTIDEWLEENYPVLASLYHQEIVKAIIHTESLPQETNLQRQSI